MAQVKSGPDLSVGKAHQRAERSARLARALRDNLRRRKEQARARADQAGDDGAPLSPGLSGGALSSKTDRRGGNPTAE